MANPNRLSPREQQVYDLLLTPATLRDIATTLGIKHASVQTYTKRVITKCGAHTRVELVARALAALRIELAETHRRMVTALRHTDGAPGRAPRGGETAAEAARTRQHLENGGAA